jgi:hypothetical protein
VAINKKLANSILKMAEIDQKVRLDGLKIENNYIWSFKDQIFSFCSFQCNLIALNLVSSLNSMIFSLMHIGVSLGLVLGLVDLFSKSSQPYFLKADNQYLIVRSENGHTLTIFLIDISLSNIGLIQRYFSSFVDLGIVFICP